MSHPNAVLAALCVFNGLHLSPVMVSPSPQLQHIGDPEHPRFKQCAAYLCRFFGPDSTVESFAPLEVLGASVAVAPWIRGAVGFLQHELHHSEDMDIPNCEDVDPAEWFADLQDIVIAYRLAAPVFGVTSAAKVQEHWEEPDHMPLYPDSQAAKVARLYRVARDLQSHNELLSNAVTIARERRKVEKSS